MPSGDYARTPEMQLAQFSLNQLVGEVVELYRLQDRRCSSAWTSTPSCLRSKPTAAGTADSGQPAQQWHRGAGRRQRWRHHGAHPLAEVASRRRLKSP